MPTVLLRLLSKRGSYPCDDLISRQHLLRVSDAVPWSAVVERVQASAEEYSEVQVLSPEEVQLFAAVGLSVGGSGTNGHLSPEPWTDAQRIELPSKRVNLSSPKTQLLLSGCATQLLAGQGCEDDFAREPEYEYRNSSTAESLHLLPYIDPEDRLLIRGLSKFLTAKALVRERWFLEEAGIAAFISLEAAMTMIRQHLEGTTRKDASFHDAYDYLRSTFPTGDALADWLLELYDLRTIAMHPSSRFGEYWTPPLDADHCLEAIDWLVPLYRHILVGEVPDRDEA